MGFQCTDTQSVPADDSVSCVLVPRAVLDERFYRSRSCHKQGRRQEPCSTPKHPPTSMKRPRFPGAVLLRSAIQKRYTAKVVLGLFEGRCKPTNCYSRTQLWSRARRGGARPMIERGSNPTPELMNRCGLFTGPAFQISPHGEFERQQLSTRFGVLALIRTTSSAFTLGYLEAIARSQCHSQG
jgi:hypothetical protein